MLPAYPSPLLNHLWQSTLFAAVAGLLAVALRSNSSRTRYWLWLIASVKFLIPFSLLIAIGGHLQWRAASVASQPGLSFVEEIGEPFLPQPVAPSSTLPTVPAAMNLIPVVLFAVWMCGFVAVVFFWWSRWRRIRAAVRVGRPLDLSVDVPVLSSPSMLEPGVFGIFHPVLLLPEGITDHLAPTQLDAILAHELCHVRRRDNLAAAIHMLVEAMFWFHPFVWWIGARLVEERERACDEEVLRQGGEPQIYAESILKICQFYLQSPLVCVSGVTGSDLKKRIVRIMTHGVAHKLNLWKKLLLAAAGVAVVAGPIATGMANPPQGQLQAQALLPPRMEFEVASVRPNMSGGHHSTTNDTKGRFTAVNITLENCIERAYDVRTSQISGPDWLKSERYDIAAKAVGYANKDQVRLMLQALLAERFKLTLHREEKVLPVYGLVVAKNGPKLKQVEGDGHSSSNSNEGHLSAQKISMAKFAEVLSRYTDRPVVDNTGLQGAFNIELAWAPDNKQAKIPEDGTVTDDNGAPSLFTAVREQLGLKLEARKGPLELLVIDHVERVPAEN